MALTTNEKWNYGLALGAMGAIVGMAVFSRKKERTLREIGKLDEKVLSLGSALYSWNLKHDPFPNIDEWLDKNWNAPYGREQAREYLTGVMKQRSDAFFGIRDRWNQGRDEQQAYNRYRGIISDLKGGAYKYQKLASLEERKLAESGLRLRKKEKPPVPAPVRLYTMKKLEAPASTSREDSDWDALSDYRF